MPNGELNKLYVAVSSKFNIGDEATFNSKMQTAEDRKKFYEAVAAKGFDLGDYDTYEKRLGGAEVKKKEPTPEEKGVQSTNGSQTVSEQQSKSGAGVKTPTTYQWSSGSQQNYGITTPTEKEQRKVVSKNIVSDYHEKLEKNNDVYSKAQNNSDIVSIVDYYPFYNDVKRINQRLTEIGEPKTKEQIQEHNKLVEEYNAIRNKPISEYEQPQEGNTIDIADKNGNTTKMQLIKDMGAFRKELRTSKSELKNAKTVGELLDAQGQAITNFNALVPEMKVASEDLNNTIKEYQKSAGYTDKDMGFWESFSHSAIRSLDNMRLYAMSEGEQASEIKRMELEDELTPKEASGVLGSIGEISGGLAPYITLGALTGNIGGWTGVLATSLSQGLAGGTEAGGRSLYDTYRELKANGVNEQEALRVAHKVANFNAAASGVAFGTIGLFGGEGLGDVASKAMYEGLGGDVAKKTALKSVIGKLKDQSIAPIIFGANRAMQNLYSNYEGIHRDLDEGVVQDMMFPVALHASMAALAGGAKFVGKTGKEAYDTYTTFVAKSNPQSLQYILNEAVKNGVIDEAHAQKVATDVQNKAEIIAQMPQMPFDKLQEGIPAMQNWLNAKRQLDKAKQDGSPFLPQAEALEKEAARKVQETLGTPLSPKEQKTYEELSARKKESQANKEAQGLSPSEKTELAHYEDRVTHSDRVENIPQEKPFRVKSKNGETGLLIKNEDGDMEFIPDGNKPSRVFERNEATPKKTIQELGFTRVGEETIEKPKSQILTGEVKEGADVLFGGRRYTLTGVVKDADGKITKVKLRHKNGDTITISDRSAEGKKLISDANKMIGKAAKEETIKRQQEEEAAKLPNVEPTKGYTFIYESEKDIPKELRGIEPIVKGDINGKPRLTFSGKQLIDAGLAKEQKAEANDKENITGVSSEVGVGQEPIETQPKQEGSGGEVEGGGVLEKTQEVAPTETVSETEKYQRIKTELPKSEYTTEDDFKNDLENGEWALLTAENPNDTSLSPEENAKRNEQAEQWLIKKGYKPQKVAGKYNRAENSFYVKGMTKADAIAFANIFGQENVATDKGLYYQDGSFEARIKSGESYGASDNYVSAINVNGKPIEFSVEFSKDKTKPTKNEKQVSGNRLFSKPLEVAKAIADRYAEKLGFKRSGFEKITKANFDKERAKRIAKAFDDMQNNPNDQEVKAAYEAMAKETIDQYKEIMKDGYRVEVNNDEPYSSSEEMIEDLRDNKRMKIFSTESGFGDEAITEQQRKENPLLRDSGFKDANGVPLLVNDIFRFVHDFFGHSELGNSFGELGEENAWNVHARMYSPLARRAMTTETRGQNSWVNSSGINKEAFEIRDKARKLREVGEDEAADVLVKEVYDRMKFAEQKVGLLPEEFSKTDDELLGKKEPAKDTQTGIKAEPTAEIIPEGVQLFESALTERTEKKRDKALKQFGDKEEDARRLIDNYDTNLQKLKDNGVEPTGTKAEVLADMLSGKYDEVLNKEVQPAEQVSEATTQEKNVGGGKKKTITTKRAYEGEFREEVKRELEKIGLTREVESQEQVEADTKAFIESVGLDAAVDAVRAKDIEGAHAMEILNSKIEDIEKQMLGETDPDKLIQLAREQGEAIDELDQLNVKYGRGSSYMNRIYAKSDLGYNVEKLISDYKKENDGEISPEVEAKFRELDKQLKETNKKLKEAEERLAEREAERAVANIKESVSRRKTRNKKEEAKQLIGEGLSDLADALGVKLMAVGDKRASIVTALSKIGRGLILNGEATLENVSQKVREYVNEKFGGKLNFDEYEEDFNATIAEGAKTSGKIKIETQLIRDLVESGVDNIDDLVAAVKERVAVDYPNATDREIRDAITGYGKIVNPTRDEVSVQLRKMKDIGRIISALEDIEKGKRPMRSGLQRDKPDAEQRAKRKELREALKELQIDEADLERQLKTQLDAAKQRLQNQIEDLDRQIQSGEKDVKSPKAVKPDAEMQALIEKRDALKKEYDEKFKDDEYREAKRTELAKRAAERRIAELQRRLKEGDFSKKEKKPVMEDTELTRLKAEKIRIKEEYDKEFYKAKLKNRKFFERAKDYMWDAWGLTRALSATADLSFVGVQGWVNLLSHPIQSAKAFKTALQFAVSEKRAEQWLNNLKAQEWYPILKESKLSITEPKAEMTAREELFNSGWTNVIWDVVGSPLKLANDKAYQAWVNANPMKALERASVGYLDTIRVQRFLDGMQMLEMQGKNIRDNKQDFKNVADVINTFTGRASLGAGEQIAPALTKVFFSPRNWASILKQTILLPRQVIKWQDGKIKPSVANKMAIGDLSKALGLTSAMVMMAAAYLNNDDDPETSIETDTTSSDFGKIKLGETRVDPWGGRIQQVILMSRLITDSINKGGKRKPLGTGFGSPTREELIMEQAFNKLSPSAQLVHRYLTSKPAKEGNRITKYGEEYEFSQDVLDRLHPIIYDTIKELLEDDPNALDGLLIFYAMLGGGVNTYQEKKEEKKKVSYEHP